MKKSHAGLLWAVLALSTGTAFSQTPQPAPDPDPFAKIAAKPAQAAVEGGIPVEVVDDAGKPLVGIAVAFITREDTETPEAIAWQMEHMAQRMTDPAALMAEMAGFLGSKFVTDENGQTSVPRDRGEGGALIAFRGREVAHRELDWPLPAEGIRIAFVPPLQIDVEVVDSRGRPAPNLPIGIATRREPILLPIAQSHADEGGHARIRIERERVRGYSKMFVEALVPLKEPLFEELDLVETEHHPIRFQLPPTGLDGPFGGEDSWGRSSSENKAQFDAQGVAQIPVPNLDALQLTVACMGSDGGASIFRRIYPAFEQGVEIDPEADSQRIEIEITDEHRRKIQQATQRMRR